MEEAIASFKTQFVFQERKAKKTRRQLNISQLAETWIVMVGTLIWGFGDLLGKIFK